MIHICAIGHPRFLSSTTELACDQDRAPLERALLELKLGGSSAANGVRNLSFNQVKSHIQQSLHPCVYAYVSVYTHIYITHCNSVYVYTYMCLYILYAPRNPRNVQGVTAVTRAPWLDDFGGVPVQGSPFFRGYASGFDWGAVKELSYHILDI